MIMDKLQWFKFSILDWNMGKIQRAPEITQLRFIRLCCLYWNKECALSVEDAEIEIDKEHLDILIARKIVKSIEDFVRIDFLDEQYGNVLETSEKRKKAADARWKNNDANDMQLHASAMQDNQSAMQSDADKSRVEESRVEKKEKINNIEERKLKFADTLKPFLEKYGKEMLNDFYKYWSEANKTKTKFKQEMQKTWDVSLRLEKWSKNSFNNKPAPVMQRHDKIVL